MCEELYDIELEPAVEAWLDTLSDRDHAAVERLAEFGDRMPYGHARDLGEGLWELRFDIAHHSVRLTYWLAEGRRAVLLTAFYKTRDRQPRDVERARKAMAECMAGGLEHGAAHWTYEGRS
ncbi:type II toxin-antitoxin system RelE/ParE family toxin [Nonomuraea sp. NPDC026600]|uniref:type II toxin-antitoxin system RelE/ParE family toxin n=1 Tax=Nonomuraea sp. NPDC026600 TaxID=3155363 RepID=UPI0033DFC6B7